MVLPLIGAVVAAGASIINNNKNKKAVAKANKENLKQNDEFNEQQRKDAAKINKQSAAYTASRDKVTDAYAANRDAASDAYIYSRDAASDAADARSFGESQRQFDANHALALDQAEFLREQYESTKTPTTVKSTMDLTGFREASEAAGFNPFTAMRMGLASGWSSVTTSGGGAVVGTVGGPGYSGQVSGASSAGGLASTGLASAGLSLQQAGVSAPPLASAAVQQDVVGAGLNAYSTLTSLEQNAARDKAAQQLMAAELESIQNQSSNARQWGNTIPVRTTTSGVDYGSVSNQSVISPVRGSGNTSITFGGVDSQPHTGYTDAELAEQRFGDVGGSLVGLGVLAADAWNTFSPTLSGWAKRAGAVAREYTPPAGTFKSNTPASENPDRQFYNSFQVVGPAMTPE